MTTELTTTTPQVLVSNFMGRVTFPHYLKMKEEVKGVMELNAIFDPKDPIKKGTLFAVASLQKNTRIFKVDEVVEKRKARGEWAAYKITPMFISISSSHVGYWDDVNNIVSTNFIERQKD